jgi:NadR type nicotinamide-nucleotide adenylyltransferase
VEYKEVRFLKLDFFIKKQMKKIVIIGPESTGKSTLCMQLAAHYNTTWVAEYAREYLLKNGTAYTYENLLDIAKGQIEAEELGIGNLAYRQAGLELAKKSKFGNLKSEIFIDTDMYVMKVWCEFAFEKCHHWVLNRIAERKYDLYLLCNIDLPWIKDELREYPDLLSRQKIYCYYKDIMVNQNVPWVDINGCNEERLQKAILSIDKLK